MAKTELVTADERQLRFTGRAVCPYRPVAGGGPFGMVQQDALADTQLTAQDEGSAPADVRGSGQFIEAHHFGSPADGSAR
ncbi:hypothetical protein [Streptomyces sp. NPDC002853]